MQSEALTVVAVVAILAVSCASNARPGGASPRPDLRFDCPCEPASSFTYTLAHLETDVPPRCSFRGLPDADVGQTVIEQVGEAFARIDVTFHVDPSRYRVRFADLVEQAGTSADAVSLPRDEHHAILISDRYEDQPTALLAPLVAHEMVHHDLKTTRDEEIFALLLESLVAADLIARQDPCELESALGGRYRALVLMFLFNAHSVDHTSLLFPGWLGDVRGSIRDAIRGSEGDQLLSGPALSLAESRCMLIGGRGTSYAEFLNGVDLQTLGACTFGVSRLQEIGRRIGISF